MTIKAGTKLDRYQILSQIGKGGMGEVYLAQDTRLGRKVALKLLPAQYTEDPERLRRFEQEAYAVSALNHPNIVTIYEIGEAEGRPFIATEFIEGITLRRKMAGARLSIPQILDIATQAVSALAAAHAAGIVHRDIKPENIMIRPDGYVKMLDFGLAKLTERTSGSEAVSIPMVTFSSENIDTYETGDVKTEDTNDILSTIPPGSTNETVPGVVMGTAQYMSPEQARGLRVDLRTDIFSFGIVIYEMIGGRSPFRGANTRQIIESIIHTEPQPIMHLNPEVPEVLEWIVSKALVKDRDERYQTAKEMLNDLRRLHHRLGVEQELGKSRLTSSEVSSDAEKKPSQSSGQSTIAYAVDTNPLNETISSYIFAHWQSGAVSLKRNKPFLVTLISLIVVIALFIAYLIYSSPQQMSGPFQKFKVSQFTTSGRATRAAISPDGNYVVHVLSDAGKQSLHVRQVTQSNNIMIVPPAEVIYRGLTFSHDGTQVYYVVQEGNNTIQFLYQVPVLGGTTKKILTNIDSPVAISPNNKLLAFVRRSRGKNEDALILTSFNGENERQLATRRGDNFYGVGGPEFSPDGKTLACPAGTNIGGRQMYIAEIDVQSGKERPIATRRWANVGRVSWLHNGRGLIISATEQGSNLAQLWHISYPKGEFRQITSDLNDYRDMSLTDDSRALVTIRSESLVNIWLIPGTDSTRAKKITDGIGQYSGVGGITWQSSDQLVFVSRASGSQDIWLMDRNGQNQKQLTTAETRADRYPTVSPDGRYIVFVSTRTGSSNLYRYDLETGEQKRLTHGTSEEFPVITPDGKWVIFTATGSIKFTLWKVPIDGGEPIQLTNLLSEWPAVSPDGKWLSCWFRPEAQAKWQIGIIPIEGGDPVKVFAVPSFADPAIPLRWMPDGLGISFASNKDGVWNIWNQPLDGSAPKQLTNFTSDQIFWFDWSRDGKTLACSRGRVTSDVVLITEMAKSIH